MLQRGRQALSRRLIRAGMMLGVFTGVAGCSHHEDYQPPVSTKILFVGNSFTYGHNSPALHYNAQSITDLNQTRMGGMPGIFKMFTQEAGLHYDVSIEAVGGTGLDFHINQRRDKIDRPWDNVVLQDQSVLGKADPGNSELLVKSVGTLDQILHARNPGVQIWLAATWPYPTQVRNPSGHWYGRTLGTMASDVQKAYGKAAEGAPQVKGVIPVGTAFVSAIDKGFADGNPRPGGVVAADKVSLWGPDNKHASVYGVYLEALMVFGRVTGRDPASLGTAELAAAVLGIAPDQAATLQSIAHDTLAAEH